MTMFKEDFLFGASLSGFQFEMGGKESDKNTDWYVWSMDELNALNGVVSGDLPENGPNYWENYGTFHNLAINAGMNALRIGLEWSRIFPGETFGKDTSDLRSIADMDAIEHYKRIMTDIKGHGMKLIVNLNHFTLPLWAHDPLAVNRKTDLTRPGWVDDRLPDEFAKYAAFVVEQFDDLVDYWSTMTEPNIVANLGYLFTKAGFPPSIIVPNLLHKVMGNLIKAHNRAYKAMKKKTEKPIGIIYATVWFNGDDSAKEAFEYSNYRFLDAVKDDCDFIGVNYYTRSVVRRRQKPVIVGDAEIRWENLRGYGYACTPNGRSRDGRFVTDNGWEFYPEGLEKVLRSLHRRYNKTLYIMENGVADTFDVYRAFYLLAHLNVVERLQEECDIRGYFHWSLTDNFEWAQGFSKQFGLVYVDFEKKTYIPRPSYYLFREIGKERSVTHFKGLLDLLEGDNRDRLCQMQG